MIKAVVFDLDDTLYPEYQYVLSGFKAVAGYIEKETALKNVASELLDLFNSNRQSVFDRFIFSHRLNMEAILLHNIYINHYPEIFLYDDVLGCLAQLKRKGYKLGIITDGRPIQQRNKIQSLKIQSYFDSIVISDEFGIEFRKPHPKPFEYIKNDLSVGYDEMAYIGDNPAKDFYISALYPVQTIQLERGGYYSGEYYKNVEPGSIIKTLSELEKKLEIAEQ